MIDHPDDLSASVGELEDPASTVILVAASSDQAPPLEILHVDGDGGLGQADEVGQPAQAAGSPFQFHQSGQSRKCDPDAGQPTNLAGEIRGGSAVEGLSDVINVRLKASLPLRIDRVMQDLQLTPQEAAAFVEEKDVLVADFARTSYGLSPDDLSLFDIVIDTGRATPDSVVGFLVEVASAQAADGGEERPSAAALEVDPVIASVVSDEFKRVARLRTSTV